MPIYEYLCAACGRRIEVMHGIHGHGPAACEHCGGAMRKLLSTPAIHFKGSGWAKKDARSSSGSTRPGAAKTAETTGAKSAEGAPSAGETQATDAGGAAPTSPSTAPKTAG